MQLKRQKCQTGHGDNNVDANDGGDTDENSYFINNDKAGNYLENNDYNDDDTIHTHVCRCVEPHSPGVGVSALARSTRTDGQSTLPLRGCVARCTLQWTGQLN